LGEEKSADEKRIHPGDAGEIKKKSKVARAKGKISRAVGGTKPSMAEGNRQTAGRETYLVGKRLDKGPKTPCKMVTEITM